MLPSAILALALCPAASYAAEPAEIPAPQLLTLEKTLSQKLDDRRQGLIPPDQYRQFSAQFRADLDRIAASLPQTPVNQGRRAMILSRLDDSGPGEALAGLDRALQGSPDSNELLNAKGTIQLQQNDYAGALASAERVLKYNREHGQPPDPGAVALREFSKGRGPATQGAQAPTSGAPDSDSARPSDPTGRQGIQFTPRPRRDRVEIPLTIDDQGAGGSGPSLIGKSSAWAQNKIVDAQQNAVGWVKRKVGFEPGEEESALNWSINGAIYGAEVGSVGAVIIAGIACYPAIVTGAPYAKCLLAAGAGGIGGGAVVGAFIGAGYGKYKEKTTRSLEKLHHGESVDE